MTCPFCTLLPERIVHSNALAVAIRDGYPVSPGHTLIIPKRHIASFFDATAEERQALLELLDLARNELAGIPPFAKGAQPTPTIENGTQSAPHFAKGAESIPPFEKGGQGGFPTPAAFNIGINDGPAAGQTVPHLHIHLIPRYEGDSEDPRGGVRWVMPGKANYWSTP